MGSLSSLILSNITMFRNPNGPEQQWVRSNRRKPANPLKVALAEVGYLLTIPFAIVETAFAALAKAYTYISGNRAQGYNLTPWLKSSAFSILWATGDVLINPLTNDLIVTERVARACALSGNIFSVPQEAL